MPVKYSEIKKKFKIEVKEPEQSELAYLTHFLHNAENGVADYYRAGAEQYAETVIGKEAEPWYRRYLPIKWDIPFPPPQNPTFKFIDLFAGIGGFRMAFQNLGGKCVFTSEWNHYAQKTYEANFGEVPFGDITKIDESEIPDHDILV